MTIHEKLRKLRHEKGLSQAAIAEKLYMGQNAYSLLESGKTKIDVERIFLLAKILDVNPFELLMDDTERSEFCNKTLNEYTKELIMELRKQLTRKDEQIDKLLLQVERFSPFKLD